MEKIINIRIGDESTISDLPSHTLILDAVEQMYDSLQEGNTSGQLYVSNSLEESELDVLDGWWSIEDKKNHDKVLLVYTCDIWHTKESRELIGVLHGKDNLDIELVKFVENKVKQDGGTLDDDSRFLLQTIKQTQGLQDVDYEIIVDSIVTNNLL